MKSRFFTQQEYYDPRHHRLQGRFIGQRDRECNQFSNNGTLTAKDASPQGLSRLYVLLTTLFFSLIISAGLFGNSLIVATLTCWREMRTPYNLLIANICVSDLGVCVNSAPLRINENYLGWIFGDVVCFILTPLQDVFAVVSVVTQTAIALERHRAIETPTKPKITSKRVKTLVPVIRVAYYLTAGIPMMIFLKKKLYDIGNCFCYPVFTSDGYRTAYEVYLVVVFIVLPRVIQCAAYLGVIRALRARNRLQPNRLQKKICNERARKRKRLIRMLLLLMLVFQACYLPRGVITLMQEFTPKTTLKPEFRYVEMITLAMYYLKHIINPFILWAMSNDFRTACLRLCLR